MEVPTGMQFLRSVVESFGLSGNIRSAKIEASIYGPVILTVEHVVCDDTTYAALLKEYELAPKEDKK